MSRNDPPVDPRVLDEPEDDECIHSLGPWVYYTKALEKSDCRFPGCDYYVTRKVR